MLNHMGLLITDSMHDQGKQTKYRRPATYPSTATSELKSKRTFMDLLDAHFVKGDLDTLDKNPNTDGILTINDTDQAPIGKIEIQLKTLSPTKYHNPGYSLDESFIAYCEVSILPVLLVAVNIQNKKAYWRHIGETAISEYYEQKKGATFFLPIPLENCIDGVNTEYLAAWTKLVKERRYKLWNYDSLYEQKKKLEATIQELESKFQNPIHLPLPIVKEIHRFMDYYNYILDLEFTSVKQILYPEYWKIGIGITKYTERHIQFLLFPIEFKKSQTLVKEIKQGDYEDIFKEMSQGNILLLANLDSGNKIREQPKQYAYKLLEDSILRIAGKFNFPIDNTSVAHEYIVSFIDRYHGYLNFDKDLPTYPLKSLKYMLYTVLPMLAATQKSFADHVTQYEDEIESYHHIKATTQHKKAINNAISKIKEGFLPKVRVTLTSRIYNMELITYYTNLLETKGSSEAKRVYKTGQFNETLYGIDFWKTWNKDVLWHNIQLFFTHFYQLYESFLDAHFPNIKQYLGIVSDEETTIVHIFHFDESHVAIPIMEVYHLRPHKKQKGQVLCYLSEDSTNPIDRKKFFINEDYSCTINGDEFEITLMHAQALDFMFTTSPTYSLINTRITEKLQEFFSERKRKL